MSTRPRIALCHEWTTVSGGSEQVASRLASVLGVTDVYTFAADPALAARLFPGMRIHTSRLGATGFGRRHWPWLLPAMPRAWAALDLSAYDLVVTSSHACVNAIRVRPGAAHLSYCHTPMRYAWDWQLEIGRIPGPLRPAWPRIAGALRAADRARSQHVTTFVANSAHVASRIRACYGRDSSVVHPPVDTRYFSWDPATPREDFFLVPGRLVAYKRPAIAVEAAARAGVRLVVAGAGPELEHLRRIAGPRTAFVEAPSRAVLRDLYRRCRAVLNPGVEDLGMTMVEAQACGAPVIALDAGGAREIVRPGRTGLLYPDASADGLAASLAAFDHDAFAPQDARTNGQRFAAPRFDASITRIVDELIGRRRVPAVLGRVATPVGGR